MSFPSRLSLLLVALCLALLPGMLPAQADADDPSELFLKAFTSVQQGEKLERDGKFKAAVSKYRFAASLLEQIAQRNPNWQPLIVSYRTRKTAEAIGRAEQRIQFEKPDGSAPPEVAAPPVPQPTPPPAAPVTRPSRYIPSGDGTDPLPTNEPEMPASVRRVPPPAGAGGSTTLPLPAAQAPETISRSAQDAKSRLDKLQRDLEENRKQLAAAKEQRDKLENELNASRAEAKKEKKRADSAAAEATDLEAQLKKAKDIAQEAVSKNPDAAETRKALREQVAELKKQVAAAEGKANSAASEREEVAKKLAAATERVEALTSERDAAKAQAESGKDASARIDALLASNAETMRKLEAAESTVQRLTEEAEAKRKDSESLRREITSLRGQLDLARDQNDKSATVITDMRAQLEQATKDLADVRKRGATSDEINKMTRENELLKGIVLQQLKEQAKREQAKKLLTSELARLEVQSKTLTEQVELMGAPTLKLSDEVRALFRDAEISTADGGSTSMAVTIATVKQRRAGDTPDGADPAVPEGGSTPPPGPMVETNMNPNVPADAVGMAREMKEQLDGGKYVEAEKGAERILAKYPDNLFARSSLGVAQLRQGKLKQAEITLKRALASNPNDAYSRSSLGIVYYRMKKFDEAIDQLTRAIALDPKSPSAHNHLGIVAGQKGWPEAAEQEFKKAIALNPNYADAHFNLAVIYATNQPPSKQLAQQHYRRATQLGATPDPTLERLIGN
ncbi:MAG: tetratricopeptide repeat protein [Verrucomicrobia bacterium]|nr:tetratricopeptide repeat protein [Verrucomicrobiota bacterium]